jgi:DNA-binding NarL/FixJ family response regulator
MHTIKVILADDHQIVRNGIKMLVEGSEVTIIDEAANGLEVLEKIKHQTPDLVLMDISMPQMNGLEATRQINKIFTDVKVLILSMFDSEDYILSAVEAGAKGYLLKDAPKEEILDAIRKVAAGDKYFNSSVSNIIINGYLRSKQNDTVGESNNKLSNKEKVILKLIVKGQNSREIAESLDLSVRTVDNHRANMMKKLSVKNAVELVKTAIEKRLV